MNHDTVSVDRSDFGTFIHSELDDAGLSPYAFRIYCHLARRANVSGKAWPGACSMSRICGMSENTVRKAIGELEARNMVKVKRSRGGRESNHYHLNSKKFWTPADDNGKDPFTTCRAPLHHMQGTPSPHAAEGNPSKEIQEGELMLCSNDGGEEKADPSETIYAEYPRKASKPHALKAIRAALKKVGFDELLSSVKSYAATVKAAGTDTKFIPYPATWFNGERWKDNTPNTTHDTDNKPGWLNF